MSKLRHDNLVQLLAFCDQGNERLLVLIFDITFCIGVISMAAGVRRIQKPFQTAGEARSTSAADDNIYEDDSVKGSILSSTLVEVSTVYSATNNFSDKLGEGGFGPVYKGILPDGQEIAIKRLSKSSGQGSEEFKNELTLHHLAEVNGLESVERSGYISPEYAMEGKYSEKSDVFSFGVLILEVVSGRRNNSFVDEEWSMNLLGYAWTLWKEGSVSELIDPLMGTTYTYDEVCRCIQVGLLCVQELPAERPTMSQVLRMLSGDVTIPSPKQAAFFVGRVPHLPVDDNYTGSVNQLTYTDVQGR
ncbi:Cysteine-rich receptor-like protein kinase 10 [Dichanthelium oligosanthes]|uniref:Cysteine-rich receptor-like protein kinase 10 n=1 Tax=Dichanthelium oligosanthes TaxID=888268 RepID=A0A1E5VM27_9POAL|nr:Cysteine-rich receptor-like protein kinase 10 [Dichanthelium oligosanthes]